MRFSVDLSLFEQTTHNPSYFSLLRDSEDGHRLRDYCIPVNPYFPTTDMFERFARSLKTTLRYYPSSNEIIAAALAETLQLDPDTVLMANGSTELICWINTILVKRALATTVPTFGRWTDYPRGIGLRVELFQRRASEDFRLDVQEFARFVRRRKVDAVAICNPNNPTGSLLTRNEVLQLIDELSDINLIVVDESFIDFARCEGDPSMARIAPSRSNLVVIKSLGKSLGLHGVRAGYAVANPLLATRLRSYLPSWNVNSMAESLIFELRDCYSEFVSSCRRVREDSIDLQRRLAEISDLHVYPSQSNFVYLRLPTTVPGRPFRDRMLGSHGCLLRMCGNKLGSGEQFFRVAARPAGELDYLLGALREQMSRELPGYQPADIA